MGSNHYNRKTTRSSPRKPTQILKLDKPSSLQELHAKVFEIDEKVQRTLNDKRVREMAENFQPHALGLMTASKRSTGHIVLLDGQHRVSAARIANYNGLLPTRVFEGLTIEEEAGLFLNLNNARPPMPIDKFKVRVTRGDEDAVNINKILKAHGLSVTWASSDARNSLSAIGTLEKVYHGAGVRPYGGYSDLVDVVIATITRSYADRTRSTFSRPLIEGLGIFFATFGKRIDRDRLQYVLSRYTPRELESQARVRREADGGTLGEAAARLIHKHYNHRYRVGKLPGFDEIDPASYQRDDEEADYQRNRDIVARVEQREEERQLQHTN